jgi:hypothetical protein
MFFSLPTCAVWASVARYRRSASNGAEAPWCLACQRAYEAPVPSTYSLAGEPDWTIGTDTGNGCETFVQLSQKNWYIRKLFRRRTFTIPERQEDLEAGQSFAPH